MYFAQQNYDAVLYEDKVTHKLRPFYTAIDTAFEDCKILKKAVSKYKISGKDKYYTIWNRSYADVLSFYKEI